MGTTSEKARLSWQDLEIRAKRVEAIKCAVAWRRGVSQSKESNQKRSISMRRAYENEEVRKRHAEGIRNSWTDEKRAYYSQIKKDKMKDPEFRNILKEYFKHHPEENKKKGHPSESGELNRNWKGGLSKLPYAFSFTKALKETIKDRDGRRCSICKALESKVKLHIHHIDYCKTNSQPSNLITLCHSCHEKTNGKRDYWKAYFVAFPGQEIIS